MICLSNVLQKKRSEKFSKVKSKGRRFFFKNTRKQFQLFLLDFILYQQALKLMIQTPEQISQQNRLFLARLRIRASASMGEISYSRQELPQLVSKYEGYMQIHKRKQGTSEPKEYYNSSLLSELREKRNSMFSDEIIDKMVKTYGLVEYASEVEWRRIASNGIDLSRTKFGSSLVEIEGYRQITNRMLDK